MIFPVFARNSDAVSTTNDAPVDSRHWRRIVTRFNTAWIRELLLDKVFNPSPLYAPRSDTISCRGGHKDWVCYCKLLMDGLPGSLEYHTVSYTLGVHRLLYSMHSTTGLTFPTVHLCVLDGCQDKQRSFRCRSLSDRFL